jgi:hypothetical protein
MKTYKELAEVMEQKIDMEMRDGKATEFDLGNLIDGWIAFSSRDKETPKEEKRQKYMKVIDFLEKKIEEKGTGEHMMSLIFSYIALRQSVNEKEDGEREAQALQLIP